MSQYPTMKINDEFVKRVRERSISEQVSSTSTEPSNTSSDLSKWCGVVFNQLSEGSCTACTTRDYLMWLENKYGYSPIVEPAVNALYYYARKIYGDITTDSGATTYDAFQGSVTYGVVPVQDEAYNQLTLYQEPPTQDIVFKASSVHSNQISTASIRNILDSGIPVGISVSVCQSLFQPVDTTDGLIAVVDDSTIVPNEGHAILVVGYQTHPKYGFLYRFQNSWGTGYGDKGFAWFTEAYLTKNLYEVCTLDIPTYLQKPIPTPPEPTPGKYVLTAQFAKSNVNDGVQDYLVVRTLNGTQPVPYQVVHCKLTRPNGVFTPTYETDITGTYQQMLESLTDGMISAELSWLAPDGVTYTGTASATWGNVQPDPNPQPKPDPNPQPPSPKPVLQQIETDIVEHHKGYILNDCTCVPKELWSRAGEATKNIDNSFTVNGKTYQGVDDNGNYYIEWTVMTDNGYTISHISNGWQFTK